MFSPPFVKPTPPVYDYSNNYFLDRQEYQDEQDFYQAIKQRDVDGVLNSAIGASFRGVCPLTLICRTPELRCPELFYQLCKSLSPTGIHRDSGPLLALFNQSPDEVSSPVWDIFLPDTTDFWSVLVENPEDPEREHTGSYLWLLAILNGPFDALDRMSRVGWDIGEVPQRSISKTFPFGRNPLHLMSSRVTDHGPEYSISWSAKRKDAFYRAAEWALDRGFSWNDKVDSTYFPNCPSTVGECFAISAPLLAAECLARERALRFSSSLAIELPAASFSKKPRM